MPRDETLPALTVRDIARLRRRWMAMGAFAVLAYSAAVLLVAALSADLGFYSHQGGAILAVDGGSAAAEAGLRSGDRIIALGGVDLSVDRFVLNSALENIAPGSSVAIVVERGGETIQATFVVGRHLPLASAAGILLGTMLLIMGLLADRGGPGVLPRAFFRSTLVYVVFLAGTFSWESVITTPLLAVPWFFAMALAAPVTCHFMLKFPAGSVRQTRAQHGWLYTPPLVLASILSGLHIAFYLGVAVPQADAINLANGALCIALAAAYLTVGAVVRARRLRRKRDEIDPIAARWVHLGGVLVATPLLGGLAWALIDVRQFVGGGFKPIVGVAMVGGSACVVLAMTRVPIGELDRMWRRTSGHFIATALAAGVFLAFIGIVGTSATVLSGGNFTTAVAATLVAAILFGPVRASVQKMVDERFARDRGRQRQLLREAAESAAATLDMDSLVDGVVYRVQSALRAEGAAIYVADSKLGGWRRAALAGRVTLGDRLETGDPIAERLDAAVAARAPRILAARIVGVPVNVEDQPTALVVAPRESRHGFDDEDRELLRTIAAQLVVAMNNARAHTELHEVNEKLRKEYELAEKRRRQIARLKERVEEENRALMGQLASRDGRLPVIGDGLRATFELVQKVARTNTTALVHGETGVGKELIARAVHAGSARRGGPFVVVDCGAISPGVFESALFGHERGAFTGAIKSAPGAFRSADGGTIFLDEIGELPLDLQPKLLRVLQEREVHPVGADKPIPVDVRVVAGTNRNLHVEVDQGNFRQDLLFRLQVIEIQVPPLRDRRDDIPALAEYFLDGIAQRTSRPRKRLAPDAVSALLDHTWPGNVRELEHTLEAAIVYAEGETIRPSDLPIFEQVFRRRGERAISEHGNANVARHGLRETLEDLERDRLVEALQEHGGNRTRTAKALGMSRGALLRRMKRYEIEDTTAN